VSLLKRFHANILLVFRGGNIEHKILLKQSSLGKKNVTMSGDVEIVEMLTAASTYGETTLKRMYRAEKNSK
jgi:hypothetical protein